MADFFVLNRGTSADQLWLVDSDDPSNITGRFGLIGSLPSVMSAPSGCVLDSNGNILVTDEGRESLWRVNPTDPDDETGIYGEVGSLPSGLNNAQGIAIAANGDLYLVDSGSNSFWRVNPLDTSSTSGDYGLVGNFASGLSSANGAFVVEETGNVLVADDDSGLWRVNPTDPDDETGVYGKIGDYPPNLNNARGISPDQNGDLFLVQSGVTPELWRVNPLDTSSTSGDYGLVGALPLGIIFPVGITLANSPPSVSIVADAALVVGAQHLQLTGTISDVEDALSDLTIEWTSDSGGTFSDASATSPTWHKSGTFVEYVTLTCTVTDTGGLTVSEEVEILLIPLLAVTIPSIADLNGRVNDPFNVLLPLPVGGVPPYTTEVDGLPDGVEATGRYLIGTPTTVETAAVTYVVTDVYGAEASRSFDIDVQAEEAAPDRWNLRVDWDRSSFGHARADITSRIISGIVTKRGRNIASSIIGRSVAGTMSCQLDNSDGLFDTHNTASELAGLAVPGPTVQLRYRATPVWTGFLDTIPIKYKRGGAHKVTLHAKGVLSRAALAEVSLGDDEATVTADAITKLAFDAGIPVEDIQGTYSMPRWREVGDLLSGIQKIEATEGGFIYERTTGSLSMQDADHRGGLSESAVFVLEGTVGSGEIAAEGVGQELAVKEVVNELTGEVRQYTTEADEVIHELSEPIEILLGNSHVLIANHRGDGFIESITTPTGTDLVANSASDGSGTDETDQIQVSVAQVGFNQVRAFLIYPTRTGMTQAASVFVTTLRIKGTVLEPADPLLVDPVTDPASRTAYGLKTRALKDTWIATASDLADRLESILLFLKEPNLRVKVLWRVDDDNISEFLDLELSDRVKVRMPFYERDGFIENIGVRVNRSGSYALCVMEVSLLPP